MGSGVGLWGFFLSVAWLCGFQAKTNASETGRNQVGGCVKKEAIQAMRGPKKGYLRVLTRPTGLYRFPPHPEQLSGRVEKREN